MSAPVSKEAVVIGREDLYRRVWETPMQRLAEEFGISGNGLAKICNRLDIPYPPRGYWAKRAAGKKVRAVPLPAARTHTPSTVRISPTPLPATPVRSEAVEAVITAEDTKKAEIPVSAEMQKPHPVIARWIAKQNERAKEARRGHNPWFKPFTDVNHRIHRILDALFKHLQARDAKILDEERGGLFVEIDGEKVEIQLREKCKQIRREPSEQARGWGAKYHQELVPTGILVFSIKSHLRGQLRTEWIETDSLPMERMLHDIVKSILAGAVILAEWRKEREEAERKRWLEEQARYERQKKQKLESNRWRCLTEMSIAWKEALIVSEFLAGLREQGLDEATMVGEQTLGDWFAWADAAVAQHDPRMIGAERVFDTVSHIDSWSYRD